jgi:hypothetical protein
MQDAGNQNPSGVLAVKNNVFAPLHTTKAGTNIVTRAARCGIGGQRLAARFKIADISDGLANAPGAARITGDTEQVDFGTARETKRSHRLARLCGMGEGFPDSLKNVALGNAAGVALIDGGTQGNQLRAGLLFLTLQGAQRGAHDLAGVFVASTLDFLQHEAVKLVSQIDISGRH